MPTAPPTSVNLLLARAVRRIPDAPPTHNNPPSWLSSFVVLVVLVATNVPVVVEMVMWSPWGCLWWSSGLAFCVSASSNRQEQEQEQRHTGHCHAPFPYPWRPSTPRTLPSDHSPPPIRTESMPRCRHIRDEVSSRQQAEGRRLAGGEEGRIGARDTFRHPPNRCAPTDPPSDPVVQLSRKFLFLVEVLRNTVLRGKRNRN